MHDGAMNGDVKHQTSDKQQHAPVLRRAHGREEHEGEGPRQLPPVLLLGQPRRVQGWVVLVVVVVVIVVTGGGGEEVAPELERVGEVGLLLWSGE